MTHETGHDGLLTSVVGAIADHRGVEPAALDTPLATVVDTDALGHLFADRADGGSRGPCRIAFDYEDLTVTVDSHRGVAVAPRSGPAVPRAARD